MRKSKKAFTIVELVIVIAVIAILAAVLIPTFVNVTKSAKQSADMQAVQQMNQALAIGEAQNGKPSSLEEAQAVLREANINVDSCSAMDKDCIFYYDLTENKILIFNQSTYKVIYPQELVEKYSDDYSDDYSARKPESWYFLNKNMLEIVTLQAGQLLSNAIAASSDNQVIKLTNSVTLSSEDLTLNNGYWYLKNNSSGVVNLDLNGQTLTFDVTGDLILAESETYRISNGTVVTHGSFDVESYASFTLENVVFQSSGNGIFPCGNGSTVNLIGCTVTAEGRWGIATNASGTLSNVIVLNIEASTIDCETGPGLFVNVPCKVTVKDSVIKGNGIGVGIRCGTATFENCEIVEYGNNSWAAVYALGENKEFSLEQDTFFTNGWGKGNMVQYGGLIVGDWNANSYNYDAVCTLINTKVTVEDTGVAFPRVYLSQDGSNTTILNYDTQSDIGDVIINSADNLTRGTIIVNGEKR